MAVWWNQVKHFLKEVSWVWFLHNVSLNWPKKSSISVITLKLLIHFFWFPRIVTLSRVSYGVLSLCKIVLNCIILFYMYYFLLSTVNSDRGIFTTHPPARDHLSCSSRCRCRCCWTFLAFHGYPARDNSVARHSSLSHRLMVMILIKKGWRVAASEMSLHR